MCDVCDKAASVVATRTDEEFSAETVRMIVRMFREESEKLLDAQRDAALAEARKDFDEFLNALEESGEGEVAAELRAKADAIDAEASMMSEQVIEEVTITPGDPNQEPIPPVLIQALHASVGGPVIVVAVRPFGENGQAFVTIKAAGTGHSHEFTEKILTRALEAVQLGENGGVTEDGGIVFPKQEGQV